MEPAMDSEGNLAKISEDEVDADERIIEPLERGGESFKRKINDESAVPEKKQKIDCYARPPTVQELNQWRETENLFNSSLFRMQIEEMLKELKMKTKYLNLFNDWFREFKSFVMGLKSSKEYDLTNEFCFKELKVKPPISMRPTGDKGKFRFVCPEDITVGGSFTIEACLGPSYSIDLNIHMPRELFQKNDQVNLRFDRKRACYLAFLAEALDGSSLVEEIYFMQANGGVLKPVIELKPFGKLGRHVRVILRPVTNIDVLHIELLQPDRGNIYSEWFLQEHTSKDSPVNSATPHYNSDLAQDLVWKQNQEMLESELSAPSLRAGLILLKVWLRQRRLDKGYGGFGGFIIAMYLVYLLKNKRLNKMMSSYQVARITWNCLAQSDWTMHGISLCSASNSPAISDFHQHFEVVFLDVSGFCNLCAHVRKETYNEVRRSSAQAVTLLDASGSNNFQALFMIPVEFEKCYDYILRLQEAAPLVNLVKKKYKPRDLLDQAGWLLPPLLKLILPSLKNEYIEYFNSVGVCFPKTERWACDNLPPSPSFISVPILIGLRLNPSQAFQQLLIGPEADKPEALLFRSFWKGRSELRRFRDGRICEVVTWLDNKSPCEVVDFVLQNHFGLRPSSYLCAFNLLDQVIEPPSKSVKSREQTVIASFDKLTKKFRSLKNLSLSVNTIQGISASFHYADVFIPNPNQNYQNELQNPDGTQNALVVITDNTFTNVPKYCAPIEAVMTLELSGKWPQNLQAVRRLKAALCLQFANALQHEQSLCVQAHSDYVDIFMDNYLFRIWLAVPKEVLLMKQQIDSFGLLNYQDTPESVALEEKVLLLPRISSSLHGLHQQYPAFGPTARVAKRWLSSQFIGPPHMPDLVTELLVAFLFLSPEPFVRAMDHQLGFMHFLQLLSSTDWLTVPLIVNLNSELSRERVSELETQFHSSRQKLPPLFIATPYDRSISQFTQSAPSLQILIRLSILASEALKQFQTQLLISCNPDILPIFTPNLNEYDVIIKLNRRILKRSHQCIGNEKLKQIQQQNQYFNRCEKICFPVVDFDPVQFYLAELREGYDFCALFFHDQYGGSVIGVVWKPLCTQQQDFKVSAIWGCKPDTKSKISFNTDAILEDFRIVGRGLVENIQQKKCPKLVEKIEKEKL